VGCLELPAIAVQSERSTASDVRGVRSDRLPYVPQGDADDWKTLRNGTGEWSLYTI
jgi:hypothetical protein